MLPSLLVSNKCERSGPPFLYITLGKDEIFATQKKIPCSWIQEDDNGAKKIEISKLLYVQHQIGHRTCKQRS
jgi:hypothetical protein